MSFSHCRESVIGACLQLPIMVLMMALLFLTLDLCVIPLYATRRDAEDNSGVFLPVFRGCVISSQEGTFISLMVLLSVFFLRSEGMSPPVPLLGAYCDVRQSAPHVALLGTWYTVTELTILWSFP